MGLVPADIAQVLFEAYQEEPSLSVARCQQLAEETGLEVRQVSRWFGARRRNGPPKQLGFTVTQRNALYEAFREHGSNPPKEICHQLTLTLGLSRQQVRKWFFDHRNDQSSSKDRLRQLTSTGNKRRSTVTTPAMLFNPAPSPTSRNDNFFEKLNQNRTQNLGQNSSESQGLCGTLHTGNHNVLNSIKAQIDSVNQSMWVSNRSIARLQSQFETWNVANQNQIDSLETGLANMNQSIINQQLRLEEIAQIVGELRDQMQSMNLTPNRSTRSKRRVHFQSLV